jgi:hypothetical protein
MHKDYGLISYIFTVCCTDFVPSRCAAAGTEFPLILEYQKSGEFHPNHCLDLLVHPMKKREENASSKAVPVGGNRFVVLQYEDAAHRNCLAGCANSLHQHQSQTSTQGKH